MSILYFSEYIGSILLKRQVIADVFLPPFFCAGHPVGEVTCILAHVGGVSQCLALSGLVSSGLCVWMHVCRKHPRPSTREARHLQPHYSPNLCSPTPAPVSPSSEIQQWNFSLHISMVSFPSIGKLGCHGSEPPPLRGGGFQKRGLLQLEGGNEESFK